MKIEVELSDAEMKLVKLAKSDNINVSQGTITEIGDIFLSNLKL